MWACITLVHLQREIQGINIWKDIYQKLTMVLWELYILYFFVCPNVYFSDFSNLSIVDIYIVDNFIM